MVILTPPFRQAPRRHLRRLHQQETQQRAPLFRDMSQPALIPARFLQRHQPQKGGGNGLGPGVGRGVGVGAIPEASRAN